MRVRRLTAKDQEIDHALDDEKRRMLHCIIPVDRECVRTAYVHEDALRFSELQF